jgi:hypothetical protein
MKKILIAMALLVTASMATEPNHGPVMREHYKDAQVDAAWAVGYLAAGMVMVPVNDYLCAKIGAGPKTTVFIKVTTSLVLGSLSLYKAGAAANEIRLVGVAAKADF